MEDVTHLPTRFRFKWFAVQGRWKGELYLLPCIRFAWGREYPTQKRSYWTGLYWLQWSFHFGWNEIEDHP